MINSDPIKEKIIAHQQKVNIEQKLISKKKPKSYLMNITSLMVGISIVISVIKGLSILLN
jgi:hypothetical protein